MINLHITYPPCSIEVEVKERRENRLDPSTKKQVLRIEGKTYEEALKLLLETPTVFETKILNWILTYTNCITHIEIPGLPTEEETLKALTAQGEFREDEINTLAENFVTYLLDDKRGKTNES